MTNGEIILLYDALNSITSNMELKFNIFTGLTLKHNMDLIYQKAQEIINKRQNLYLKYGESEDGKIFIPKENVPQMQKELEELMQQETDIIPLKISMKEFGDNNFTLNELNGLAPIIEEPQE